jgi:hypothetical protein
MAYLFIRAIRVIRGQKRKDILHACRTVYRFIFELESFAIRGRAEGGNRAYCGLKRFCPRMARITRMIFSPGDQEVVDVCCE